MLKLTALSLNYGNHKVLDQLSLQAKPGEIHLITGPSGSGKSSLLKVINGIIPEFSQAHLMGGICYKDIDLMALDMAGRSDYLSSVFQNPKNQFFATDTTDEIAFALENRKLSRQEMLARIKSVTQLLSTSYLLDRDIFNLSGGEKQLVAITSVLAMDNAIYLFDEPSSSLDTGYIDSLRAILIKLKEMGKFVMIAEHRLYYLRDLVDQVHVLEAGQIKSYTKDQIDSERARVHHLRSLNPIRIEPDQQKHIHDKAYDEKADLVFKDFMYAYKKGPVIFDLNLSLTADINFIIGKNGIGKTTFLRCICQLNKGFKGKTFIKGKEVKRASDHIGLVMQDVTYQLFTESVWEEVSLASDDPEIKEETLKEMGLWDKRDDHPQSLSGGEKQRLAIAVARVSGKALIIFDEPSSGLCQPTMERMASFIQQMAFKGQKILIVTHDYELIKACGGHVVEFVS